MKISEKYVFRGVVLAFFLTALSLIQGYRAEAKTLPVKVIDGKEYYCYKVGKGADIYKIAEELGVTRNQIIKYNKSAADGIKKGMNLYFPVADFQDLNQNEVSETVVPDEEPVWGIGGPITTMPVNRPIVEAKQPDIRELKVAVCLPFMLDAETPDKTALHATDFYRGFLLAVDSLRSAYANPSLLITAIDITNGIPSAGTVDGDALRKADLVISPEDMEKLDALAALGKKNGVYVFNTFQTRDTTYLDNQYLLQGNIPSDRMYEKAISYFLKNLDGGMPVILDNETGKKDKQAFVDELSLKLDEYGIIYEKIGYEGTLTSTALTERLLPENANYVFVPSSGTLNDFQKFATALSSFKNAAVNDEEAPGRIRLFGYPEYTRFTGDAYDKLKNLETTFYSRFYNDPKANTTERIKRSYFDRYGLQLPDGVPNQALYGFDVARWVIALAAKGEFDRQTIAETVVTDGDQTDYRFEPVEDGGFVNEALLIIKLSDDTETKIEVL